MIPVTVLTGFLGSGKTTLLARLVRRPELARTAVIINEAGEIGIDHDLVEAGAESFVELETGCLCCTSRGDIEATLADLMARRTAGTVPSFERIVIETSGLADPAPLLNAVMIESGRGTGIRLSSVVATVDAATGLATLEREPQSRRQVAVADRLVLTKPDLVSDIATLLSRIRRLNPAAPCIEGRFGEIDPQWLLEESAFAGAQEALPLPGPADNAAHSDIVTITLRRSEPVRALTLTLLLEALADHCGENLLRLKAIVAIRERPDHPAIVHGVQHVFHPPEWMPRWPSRDRISRFVLIGRGLSALWIEQLLDALEAEVAETEGSAADQM
jgi:G3E family GTPase